MKKPPDSLQVLPLQKQSDLTDVHHNPILAGIAQQKTIAEIDAWVLFPSKKENSLREEAIELLNSSYYRNYRHLLVELIDNEGYPKKLLSSSLFHLNLPDAQYERDNTDKQTLTLTSLQELGRNKFHDHMRVFVLLMECLNNTNGSFSEAFTTLGMKLSNKGSSRTLLKTLGNEKKYYQSFNTYKSVCHFILARHVIRYITNQSIEDQTEKFNYTKQDNDLIPFTRWAVYFKNRLMSLTKPNTKEGNNRILEKETIAPINIEQYVTISDDEFLCMDKQCAEVWRVMRPCICYQKKP